VELITVSNEKVEDLTQLEGRETQPYLPSWFNRLNAWLDRMPGPIWITYVSFALLLFVLGVLIQILEGSNQSVTFHPIINIALFQIAYVLSLLSFLDKQALNALVKISPILKLNESKVETLKFRLVTLPSQPMTLLTILAMFLFLGLGIAMLNAVDIQSGHSPLFQRMMPISKTPTGFFFWGIWTLLWVINTIFIYHTIHQLKTIDHIYKHHTKIDLFRQSELFAFSRLSAYTGIGFVITSPVWLAIDSGIMNILINLVFSIVAMIIFVAPLMGVHGLLKDQKDELIKDSLSKKADLIRDLYARMEEKDLDHIEDYDRALSSLKNAHDEIEQISTWPWQTTTLRQLLGAILLPITIWMVQYFLVQLLPN
jgi:hypothetical protein